MAGVTSIRFYAVMDRMEDVNRSSDGSESEVLMNALNVLRDLRKMADDGDASTDDCHEQ